MKVSMIMTLTFVVAVFSNREKIRRLSFIQPMSLSTVLRRRHASWWKATGRAVRSDFMVRQPFLALISLHRFRETFEMPIAFDELRLFAQIAWSFRDISVLNKSMFRRLSRQSLTSCCAALDCETKAER
jgi:hypothetical protein